MKKVKLLITLLLFLISLDARAMRDPTRPANYAADGVSVVNGYMLNSVMISAKRKLALVNDTFVKQGDSIDGAKVIKIQSNSVILSKREHQFEVKMLGANIRTNEQ